MTRRNARPGALSPSALRTGGVLILTAACSPGLGLLPGRQARAQEGATPLEIVTVEEMAEREREAQPVLVCKPRTLRVEVEEGGETFLTLTIGNAGGRKLNWSVFAKPDWVRLDAEKGELGYHEERELVVGFKKAELGPGKAEGELVIVAADAQGSPAAVRLIVRVRPGEEPVTRGEPGTRRTQLRPSPAPGREKARLRGAAPLTKVSLTVGGGWISNLTGWSVSAEYAWRRYGFGALYTAGSFNEGLQDASEGEATFAGIGLYARRFRRPSADGWWSGVALMMGRATASRDDGAFSDEDTAPGTWVAAGLGGRFCQKPKGLVLDAGVYLGVSPGRRYVEAELPSGGNYSWDASALILLYAGAGYTF